MRTDMARAVIEHLMEEDRRWTLQELERASGIEKRTVHRIFRNDLHLRKITSRWVPHTPTDVQRWMRYAVKFEVNVMQHEQFVSTESLEKCVTKREHAVDGKALNWLRFQNGEPFII
ncbi:hypothetical protein C0J52_21550 [Blattella germanica]|nr:hypothetical protein C0J52_21550 [Blattella germanica]